MSGADLLPEPCGDSAALRLIDRVIHFVRDLDQPIWLVGGYVRDRLLCRPSHDLDAVVEEGGIRLARTIAKAFGGAWFALDPERDVGRAILGEDGPGRVELDIARLRCPDLEGDLALRDFTINAIGVDITLARPELVDPFRGRADLDQKLIRAVSEGAFNDDPLRMLRAVRMVAELGLSIEDATVNLIRRDAALLPSSSPERLRDELVRVIQAPGSWQHVRLLRDLALLPYVIPEAAAQTGVAQSPPHYQDVFNHSLSVLAHLEGVLALLWPGGPYARPEAVPDDQTVIASAEQWEELEGVLAPFADRLSEHLLLPLAVGRTRRDLLFWAALTHDWGKPAKRTEDEQGSVHFYDHDHWGALLAETRLQALKFSRDEVAYVARLTDLHMRPAHLANVFPPSRRALYRFFRDADNLGPDCALLSVADHLASHAPRPDRDRWADRLGTCETILNAFFNERSAQVSPVPLLNGRQVMAELGLSPGPQLGELLEGMREAQATGEVVSEDDAWSWLRGKVAN